MKLKIRLILIAFTLLQNFAYANDEVNSGVNLSDMRNYYHTKQFIPAAESATKFLKIAPENEEVKDILASSLFQLKDFKGVIKLYTDEQAEFLTSPLQLKLRAIAEAREGNYYSAMVAYRNLRDDEVLKSGWKAYYHYLVFKNNSESAFKELLRINQLSPNISNSLIMGDLYALAGSYDKAIEYFELALKKDYLNSEAMEKLADNYSRKIQYGKAVVVYRSILKLNSNRSDIKMKLAWNLEKDGHYTEALNTLDNDNNENISEYKKKLSVRIQNVLNPAAARAVATADVVSPIDGKLALEEKFIPMPPLEVATDETRHLVVNSVPDSLSLENIKVKKENIFDEDKSTFEFNLGPKAKKYGLTGVGFNAQVNYTTGLSAGLKYTFIPADRNWDTSISLNHSRTSLSNLRGLVPSSATFVETQLGMDIMYKFNSFGVGPALMFERMSTTQTTPNPIRGDVDFANLGLRTKYYYSFNEKLSTNFEFSYFSKIVTTSKTSNIGNVDKRSILSAGVKFYYRVNKILNYFTGVSYANTDTTYSASSSRGTAGAKEKEQDVTFPIGLNYAF